MDLSKHLRFDLGDPAQVQAAHERFGLHTACNGLSNSLYVHPAAQPMAGSLQMFGEGNTLVFDAGCAFNGSVVADGAGATAVVGGGQHALNLQINLYAHSRCTIGRGVVAYGLRVWVWEHTALTIGERGLIAAGVTIHTTDHHGIFDLDTLELLNPPADVTVEPHVWIGQDAVVLKGTTLGRGSIIGAKSVVNRSVPRNEMWAGSPARCIRQRVSWLDNNPAPLEMIRARLADVAPGSG